MIAWRRHPRPAPPAPSPTPVDPARLANLAALVTTLTGQRDALAGELRETTAARDRLAGDLDRARADIRQLSEELRRARTQLDHYDREQAEHSAYVRVDPDVRARADLVRAHQTLAVMEHRLALYEGRPTTSSCPRACCNPLPAAPAPAGAATHA